MSYVISFYSIINQLTILFVMLPQGLSYPANWPLMYIGRDRKKYMCFIKKVHHDDIEDVYYTIDVIEGPFTGERQTVNHRLYSYVDSFSVDEIRTIFKKCSH